METAIDTMIREATEAGFAELAKHYQFDPEAKGRIERGREDISFFEDYYLAHYFTRPRAKFHREIDALVKASEHVVIEAAREHAKSTKILALVLHAILYEESQYILMISETYTKASEQLQAIRFELEDNPRILNDFGQMEGEDWTDARFVTRTGICVQALGEGQKARGLRWRQWRPSLIVIDDPESLETTMSPQVRRKRQRWFDREIQGLAKESRIIAIATRVHQDSLSVHVGKKAGFAHAVFTAIERWPEAMNLWEEWAAVYREKGIEAAVEFYALRSAAMEAGAKVLWPEHWPLYRLMERREEMGSIAFAAEFQMEAFDPEAQRFREEWIHYYDDDEIRGVPLSVYAAVDPSARARETSDFAAVVVIGIKPGRIYVLDCDMRRRSPAALVEAVFRCYLKWKPLEIAFETNQFQILIKADFDRISREEKRFIPTKEIVNYSDKLLRISSLSSLVESGVIRFRRNQVELIQQLLFLGQNMPDDGPDALEMAVRMGRSSGPPECVRIRRRGEMPGYDRGGDYGEYSRGDFKGF